MGAVGASELSESGVSAMLLERLQSCGGCPGGVLEVAGMQLFCNMCSEPGVAAVMRRMSTQVPDDERTRSL